MGFDMRLDLSLDQGLGLSLDLRLGRALDLDLSFGLGLDLGLYQNQCLKTRVRVDFAWLCFASLG